MRAAGIIFCSLVCIFLLAPIAVLVPLSFDTSIVPSLPPRTWSLGQYEAFFSSSRWIDAIWVSVRVGIGAMVLSVVLGTLASFALVRGRFRGKEAGGMIMMAPRFVPVIIIALAFYALFARLGIVGTELGLILAHTIICTPYVIIIVSATLRGIDRRLEQASMSLGMPPIGTSGRITLPLIGSSLASAGLIAFMVSFDEVVVAIFISGTRATTLPKRMWDSLVFEMEPMLPAISTIILLATLLVFVLLILARFAATRLATRTRTNQGPAN
jgi:ABC-type spermidine/putrescine transport system permease subunit II